ncbi:MAG: hypothetical protein LZF61_11255, partial [Nitrosomonas sp.]
LGVQADVSLAATILPLICHVYGVNMSYEILVFLQESHSFNLVTTLSRYLEKFLWDSAIFEGAVNDLIVPFEGASPSNKYLKNDSSTMHDKECLKHGTESKAQRRVHHINFFDQEDIKGNLKQLLQR